MPDDSPQTNCKRDAFKLIRDFLLPGLQNIGSFQNKIRRDYVADEVFKVIKFVFTPAVEAYRKMSRLMTTCTLNVEDEELRIRRPGIVHDHGSMLAVRRGKVLAIDYGATLLEDYQTILRTIFVHRKDARAQAMVR